MTPEEHALCVELMQADLARQGPPEEFDHRGCRAVLAAMVCFWIAAFGAADWYFGWNVWGAFCGALAGSR